MYLYGLLHKKYFSYKPYTCVKEKKTKKHVKHTYLLTQNIKLTNSFATHTFKHNEKKHEFLLLFAPSVNLKLFQKCQITLNFDKPEHFQNTAFKFYCVLKNVFMHCDSHNFCVLNLYFNFISLYHFF